MFGWLHIGPTKTPPSPADDGPSYHAWEKSGEADLHCWPNRHGLCFKQREDASHSNIWRIDMHTLGTIISWIVFGLVIGLIARAVYPGRQSMGFVATIILGIVGSFVGGLISFAFGFHPEAGAFHGAGWIMSIIGSIIVVWIGLFAGSRSSRTGMRPM
jgi:uncharacterized membrane protein YeaQ/YmgE (transglycosylase-associated protein family)